MGILGQTSVIEEFMVILDNEGNHTGSETFLENDQPAGTSVPILKRMDLLKVVVKINDIFHRYFLSGVIGMYQLFHFPGHRGG